tara:strand:+ start:59 stop:277 length:219 start_codon:yes stop_codon:yes gene_type:complete
MNRDLLSNSATAVGHCWLFFPSLASAHYLNLTIMAVMLSVPIPSAVESAHISSNKLSIGGQKLFGFGFSSFM